MRVNALTVAGRAGLLCAIGLCGAWPPAAASILDSYQARIQGTVIVWGADAADPSAGVPVVSDFILNTGPGNTAATSGDHDLIAGDVHTVVTGSLTPVSNSWHAGQGAPMRLNALAGQPNFLTDTNGDGVMDASDSFSPFRIRAASDTNVRRMEIETSFYVASNIRFSIDAQATPTGSTTPAELQRVRLTLSTTQSGDDGIAFGAAAQYPHTAGPSGGSQANNRSLSTMVVPRRVFLGNQRTAAARGSLADQSVRFDLLYRYNHGNTDLSDGTFDIGAVVVYTVYIP
jgi:hypothetical protein